MKQPVLEVFKSRLDGYVWDDLGIACPAFMQGIGIDGSEHKLHLAGSALIGPLLRSSLGDS